MTPTFTDRELDVMAVLWDRGPSTVAEVRTRLADDLAHNTVLTVLRVLETKGYVSHIEEVLALALTPGAAQTHSGLPLDDEIQEAVQ